MPHVFRLPTYQDYIQSDIHFLPWVHPPTHPVKATSYHQDDMTLHILLGNLNLFHLYLLVGLGPAWEFGSKNTEVPIPTYLDVERSVLQMHPCASGKLVQSQQYDLVQNTGAPFWKHDVLDPSPGRLQSHTFVFFFVGWMVEMPWKKKCTKKQMFRVSKK